jgi:hypothetical protein
MYGAIINELDLNHIVHPVKTQENDANKSTSEEDNVRRSIAGNADRRDPSDHAQYKVSCADETVIQTHFEKGKRGERWTGRKGR